MTSRSEISRTRKAGVFTLVLVAGFAAFAAPTLLFQSGHAGGYEGANLAILGVAQLVLALLVVFGGLRLLAMKPADIGWTARRWRRDAALGLAVAAGWAALQFGWLIPATGGAGREDIAAILDLFDGGWVDVLWYLPLGVLGGGVAEEVYGRGFVITVLADLLGGTPAGVAFAGLFSAVFFAAGHLPQGWVDWLDILIPSVAYVALFLYTRRLVAPMVAHAAWNVAAAFGIQLLYG